MLEYNFPISGPLRFVTMLIECMLAFICFELGVVFVVKYRRKQASKAYKQELGYASMFLGFSVMWFCFIAADYFMDSIVTTPFMIWPSGSPRALVVSTSFMATITGSFIFIIMIERHQKLLVARFFFTILYSGLIFIFILLYMTDLESTGFMDAILVLVFMVFLVSFIVDLSKRMKSRRADNIFRFFFIISRDWLWLHAHGRYHARHHGNRWPTHRIHHTTCCVHIDHHAISPVALVLNA
jgi:hypothetical protein